MCGENSTNFFYSAYGERTQDGLICWLIIWAGWEVDAADVEGRALRDCGRCLVRALLAKHGVTLNEEINQVEVHQQDNSIDVLARINGQHVLLIEDKTNGVANIDQLMNYHNVVLNGGTALGEVAAEDLHSIFLKTGNLMYEDQQVVDGTPYKTFTRQDFLNVLNECQGGNHILEDFRDNLQCLESETNSFSEWHEENKDDWSWRSWQGFFISLAEARNLDISHWDYVPNQQGGFWNLCWASRECSYMGIEVTIYLQLEIGPASGDHLTNRRLCFRVGDVSLDSDGRATLRNALGEAIEGIGENVVGPAKPGNGQSMTYALWGGQGTGGWDDSWLVFNSTGGLDIAATVENMQTAVEWQDQAIEQVMGQTPGITRCRGPVVRLLQRWWRLARRGGGTGNARRGER